MSDLTKAIDELKEMLSHLDPEIEAEFLEVLIKKNWWRKLASLPFLKKYLANAFLHLVVNVGKNNNIDNEITRGVAQEWTGRLFKMNDDWEPGWLYEPFR